MVNQLHVTYALVMFMLGLCCKAYLHYDVNQGTPHPLTSIYEWSLWASSRSPLFTCEFFPGNFLYFDLELPHTARAGS